MSDLAWHFFVWMSQPSKLKVLAWRFFFWITPRWLSKKFQRYMLRCYVERYPGEMERKIREALPEVERKIREELAPLLKLDAQQSGVTRSEEELAALSKQFVDLMLNPDATPAGPYGIRYPQARKRRFP